MDMTLNEDEIEQTLEWIERHLDKGIYGVCILIAPNGSSASIKPESIERGQKIFSVWGAGRATLMVKSEVVDAVPARTALITFRDGTILSFEK